MHNSLLRNIKYIKNITGTNISGLARQTLDYEKRCSNSRVTIENSLQAHRDDLNELLKENETLCMISTSKLKIYCNQLFDKDWKTGLNNSPKCNTYILTLCSNLYIGSSSFSTLFSTTKKVNKI